MLLSCSASSSNKNFSTLSACNNLKFRWLSWFTVVDSGKIFRMCFRVFGLPHICPVYIIEGVFYQFQNPQRSHQHFFKAAPSNFQIKKSSFPSNIFTFAKDFISARGTFEKFNDITALIHSFHAKNEKFYRKIDTFFHSLLTKIDKLGDLWTKL
jgi:hypothetical protein